MGHTVHPISFRLYFSKFWNNNWYTLGNYSFFLLKDLQLQEYFFAFFFSNKRHRRYFYKKFMFDSVSLFRTPNKLFITLNVFDFRIKTYTSPEHFRKALSRPLLGLHRYSMPHLSTRLNWFKLRQTHLFSLFLRQELYKFRKLPWFIKKYQSNLYSKLLIKRKTDVFSRNSRLNLYRKRFFLAYYLYTTSINFKLESKAILHISFQDFLFSLVQKYDFFLQKIKNGDLTSEVFAYSQKSIEASKYTRILYINKLSIKSKIKNSMLKVSQNAVQQKILGLKKYFFLAFNNLTMVKNLIIKYKNLLFLVKKRINLFKLKGIRLGYLNNLYWRRDRLISLIYFLRRKSKRTYIQFKSSILILNQRLAKIKSLLKIQRNSKVRKHLNIYQRSLAINISYKLLFLNLFNKLPILNKKFILFNYLNLLDNFKLLRFNYRFAVYKQGLNKIQGYSKKHFRYNSKQNRSAKIFVHNKFGFLEEKRRYILASKLNSCIHLNKFYNYKTKNFINIFYRKIARLNLRKNGFNNNFIIPVFSFSKFRSLSNLVLTQIDTLKFLEKSKNLLKRSNIHNYKYFLEFLSIKRIYHFKDPQKVKSIKSTMELLVNKLTNHGHTKFRIRKYLRKRYVFLLLKKFVNQKYGRRSIARLKLFFLKQHPNKSVDSFTEGQFFEVHGKKRYFKSYAELSFPFNKQFAKRKGIFSFKAPHLHKKRLSFKLNKPLKNQLRNSKTSYISTNVWRDSSRFGISKSISLRLQFKLNRLKNKYIFGSLHSSNLKKNFRLIQGLRFKNIWSSKLKFINNKFKQKNKFKQNNKFKRMNKFKQSNKITNRFQQRNRFRQGIYWKSKIELNKFIMFRNSFKYRWFGLKNLRDNILTSKVSQLNYPVKAKIKIRNKNRSPLINLRFAKKSIYWDRRKNLILIRKRYFPFFKKIFNSFLYRNQKIKFKFSRIKFKNTGNKAKLFIFKQSRAKEFDIIKRGNFNLKQLKQLPKLKSVIVSNLMQYKSPFYHLNNVYKLYKYKQKLKINLNLKNQVKKSVKMRIKGYNPMYARLTFYNKKLKKRIKKNRRLSRFQFGFRMPKWRKFHYTEVPLILFPKYYRRLRAERWIDSASGLSYILKKKKFFWKIFRKNKFLKKKKYLSSKKRLLSRIKSNRRLKKNKFFFYGKNLRNKLSSFSRKLNLLSHVMNLNIQSKHSKSSLLLKYRRNFSMQKSLKVFSDMLLIRNRRFFFGKFKRSLRLFLVKKTIKLEKQKWFRRQLSSANKFMYKHRKHSGGSLIYKNISKYFYIKKLRKIRVRKFRQYIRNDLVFKYLNMDYTLINNNSKKKKKRSINLRLVRNLRIRWLSFHGLFNMTKRLYRKSLLSQYYAIKNKSRYNLTWARYREEVINNKWYTSTIFRKSFYIFRSLDRLRYAKIPANAYSILKYGKGFVNFSKLKFLESILLKKAFYFNVLNFGRSRKRRTWKNFIIDKDLLRRNLFLNVLYRKKSMLNSVSRLVNPFFSKYILGNNATTRLTLRTIKLNRKYNGVTKKSFVDQALGFFFKLSNNKIQINSKKFLKKVVKLGKLSKNYNLIKSKNFQINPVLKISNKKKLVIKNIKPFKNTIKLKPYTNKNIFSFKYKKNIKNLDDQKNRIKHFYKLKKKLKGHYFIQGWRLKKGLRKKFFYGAGQNYNKLIYRWLSRRSLFSSKEYNLLETFASYKNTNKTRIFSFSSFINKTYFSVPLYFFRLPILLKKYKIKRITLSQIQKLHFFLYWQNKKKLRKSLSSRRKLMRLINLYKNLLLKKQIDKSLKFKFKNKKKFKIKGNKIINQKSFIKISKKKLLIAIKFYRLKLSHVKRDPSLFDFPIQLNLMNDGLKNPWILKKNIRFRSKFKRRLFKIKHKSKYVLNLFNLGLHTSRKKKWKSYSNNMRREKSASFNFIKYAILFHLSRFKYMRKFSIYFNEFYYINKFNLNLKRLTHANIYTSDTSSYRLYTNIISRSQLNRNVIKSHRLNDLFLKKKIRQLNVSSLNFYKTVNLLLLRNKFNYYFSFKLKNNTSLPVMYNQLNRIYSFSRSVSLIKPFNFYLRSSKNFFDKKRLKKNKVFYLNLKQSSLNKFVFVRNNIQFKQLIMRWRFKRAIRNLKKIKVFHWKRKLFNRNKKKYSTFATMKIKGVLNKNRYYKKKLSFYLNSKKVNLDSNVFIKKDFSKLSLNIFKFLYSQNKKAAHRKFMFHKFNISSNIPSSNTRIFFLLNWDKVFNLKTSNFTLSKSKFISKNPNNRLKQRLVYNKFHRIVPLYKKLKSFHIFKKRKFWFQRKYSKFKNYKSKVFYKKNNKFFSKYGKKNRHSSRRIRSFKNFIKNFPHLSMKKYKVKSASLLIPRVYYQYFSRLLNLNSLINNKINKKWFFIFKNSVKNNLVSQINSNTVSLKTFRLNLRSSSKFVKYSYPNYNLFLKTLGFFKSKTSSIEPSRYSFKNRFWFFYTKKNSSKYFNLFIKNKNINFFLKKKIKTFGSFLTIYNPFLWKSKNSILKASSFRFQDFRFFFKSSKSFINRRQSFIKRIFPNSWRFKRKNIHFNSKSLTLSFSNSSTVLNKYFFIKILNLLDFKYSFIQSFLFKFNTRLFLFVIKYLLFQKYTKNPVLKKMTETSSVITHAVNYSLFIKFINNIQMCIVSLQDFDNYIIQRKFDLIKYSRLNTPFTHFNKSQIKLNLFIIFFNILILYRNKLRVNRGNARLMLIAFKFQKYLWIQSKRRKHFSYLRNFKYLPTLKKNEYSFLQKTSKKKLNNELNWRKSFWIKISRYLILEERLFFRTNKKKVTSNLKRKFKYFRLKLKIKMLGTSYYYLSFFFKWHLTRLFFKENEGSVFFRFNILLEPTAFFLAKYICRNLRRGLKLVKIVNSIIYQLPKMYSNILSVQVKCVGRHTRKERASKDWFKNGSLRSSNIKSNIDFASVGVVLRYGYTNIKVWILKKNSTGILPGISTSFV